MKIQKNGIVKSDNFSNVSLNPDYEDSIQSGTPQDTSTEVTKTSVSKTTICSTDFIEI